MIVMKETLPLYTCAA